MTACLSGAQKFVDLAEPYILALNLCLHIAAARRSQYHVAMKRERNTVSANTVIKEVRGKCDLGKVNVGILLWVLMVCGHLLQPSPKSDHLFMVHG
jgi:hypothetical protein